MKGILFNCVADAVIEMGGDDLWDEVLQDAGLVGAYTSLGSYADGELVALTYAAAARLDVPADQAMEWVGSAVVSKLVQRHLQLVENYDCTFDLLCALNSVIHPEVLKLYPEAVVPEFNVLHRNGDTLSLRYRSARNLVGLATGLIRGASALYGEELEITVDKEDQGCVFHLRLAR